MMRGLVLALIGGFAAACHGAEQWVLPGTLSPDKKVAIVEEADGADRDYYFVQMPGKKKLGHVLPKDQQNQISNVEIVASWNAESSKVALLAYYGTKLSELLLDPRDAAGRLQPVALHEPDALEIYKQRTHRTIPQPGDGHSNNGVRPWLYKDTVYLVSGEDKQTEESADSYTHVYVTFRAHVKGKRALVSDVQLKGPLTDEASKQFEKKWGMRYFQGEDD